MRVSMSDKWQIDRLFHITPTANLDSIRSHGLLSVSAMRARDIEPIEFASNTQSRFADEWFLDSGFVYLCLHPGPKMFYNVVEEKRCGPLTLLEISTQVLETPVTLFSDKPSNSHGGVWQRVLAKHEPTTEHLVRMRARDSVYLRSSEILIPNAIPTEFIIGEEPWQSDQYSYQAEKRPTGDQ